jgi:pyridoxine 4-dehydrogenase
MGSILISIAKRIAAPPAGRIGPRAKQSPHDPARVYKTPVSAPAPDQLAAAAGTVRLGDMGVSRMGFGARWVTAAGRDLLRRALELGVDLIDTADVYGGANASEQMIADALHPYPSGLVIATKGGQTSVDGQPTPNCRPEYLKEACERSLRALRVDTIDLYQLHNPDPVVPVEESLGALVALRDAGKVRHIGVSNFFRELLDAALAAAPIASVQNQYSVGSRASDPEVDVCGNRGIPFMPWAPIMMGELGDVQALERIAGERGASPARIALAWLLARSPTMLVIPGTASIAHLEDNVAAADMRLSDDELAELTAASAT